MQKLNLNLLRVHPFHCSAGHFGPHEKPELRIVSQLVDPEVIKPEKDMKDLNISKGN